MGVPSRDLQCFFEFHWSKQWKRSKKRMSMSKWKILEKIALEPLIFRPHIFLNSCLFREIKNIWLCQLELSNPSLKYCPRILSFLRARVFRHRPTSLILWILGEHSGWGECTITPIQTICSCYVLPAVWHYGIQIQKAMMAVRIFYVFFGVWSLSCFYKQLCLQGLLGHWYRNMV